MSKDFNPSLISCLSSPRKQLRAFELSCLSLKELPYNTWIALTVIAVVGSCLYGASLSLVLPDWQPTGGALWILLSAGLGWFIFGPSLIYITKKNIFICAQACMITMAYGEGVLTIAALVNLFLYFNLPVSLDLAMLNFTMVVVSNIVMATVLTLQMQAIQVAWWKSLLTWMLALNGSGVVFFYLLRQILK